MFPTGNADRPWRSPIQSREARGGGRCSRGLFIWSTEGRGEPGNRPVSHFLLLFSLRILHVGPKLRSPELPPGDRGRGTQRSCFPGRRSPYKLPPFPAQGGNQSRDVNSCGSPSLGSRSGPPPRPPSPAQPARLPVLPPAQAARARGIVRWNTAPSSPRRGGKTPWCSPSKVRAATSQNFASPPGAEGAKTDLNRVRAPDLPGLRADDSDRAP